MADYDQQEIINGLLKPPRSPASPPEWATNSWPVQMAVGALTGPVGMAKDAYKAVSGGMTGPEQEDLAKDSLLNLLPFGKGAATAGLGKAIFAGPRALTADFGKLSKAQEMWDQSRGWEKFNEQQDHGFSGGPLAGVQKPILEETGWFRGRDGNWRFEIPDDQARVARGGSPGNPYHGGLEPLNRGWEQPLKHLFEHEPLYEAYPGLKNVTVDSKVPEGFGGVSRGLSIGIQPNNPNLGANKSILLHEIQHEIQRPEGFMVGQGPTPVPDAPRKEWGHWDDAHRLLSFAKDKAGLSLETQLAGLPHDKFQKVLDDAFEHFREVAGREPETGGALRGVRNASFGSDREQHIKHVLNTEQQLWDLVRTNPEAKKKSQQDYWNQASEVEARNVQRRMNMTPEQRRAIPPWETQDMGDAYQKVNMPNFSPTQKQEFIKALLGK